MFGQYLISFREALEAALIVSIILAYFARTGRTALSRYLWIGTTIAVIISILIGVFIWLAIGNLSDEQMTIFEGVAALIAVIVLTFMILWMARKGKDMKEELQRKMDRANEMGSMLAIIGLSFVIIFREGFETVLFLIPFSVNDLGGTIAGLVLGIAFAIAIAYLIFRIGMKIKLQKVFYLSSILLIFLAAGLLGYGIHELIEYSASTGVDPGWFGAYAYDLGIPEGDIFHHKGAIGSILAVIFGYSVRMEWGRLIFHLSYLAIFLSLTVIAYRRPEWLNVFAKIPRKIASLWKGSRKADQKSGSEGS